MKILASTSFSIISFAAILLLFITYIKKKKNKDSQNLFFMLIMICCHLSSLSELFYVYCISMKDTYPTSLISFACKTYLIFVIFSMFFTICYSIIIRTNKVGESQKSKSRHILILPILIIYILSSIVIIVSTIEIKDVFLYQFISPSIDAAMSICYVVFLSFIFAIYIKNDNIPKNNKLPLSFATIFIVIIIFLQIIFRFDFNHQVLLLSLLLMALYFTAENQDFILLEELEKTRKEAEEENEMQTKLLGNISHSISSPMNIILGYSDLLLTESNLNLKIVKNDISHVRNSAKYLLNLTDSISDVSNIDEELIEKEYDLHTIIDEIKDLINTKFTEKNILFSINVSSGLPTTYYGDIIKIIKMIKNILTHAYQYTNNGTISLEINEIKRVSKDISISINIKTSGYIMKQELDKDINDYLNNSNTMNNDILSLIIAKRLINTLGGESEFSSQSGIGTSYVVKLDQMIVNDTNIGNINIEINTKKHNNFIDYSEDKVVVDGNAKEDVTTI